MSLIKCKYYILECTWGEKTFPGCINDAGHGCDSGVDQSYRWKTETGFTVAFVPKCKNLIMNEVTFEKESNNYELRRNKNCYGNNVPSSYDWKGYLKVGTKTIPLHLIDYLEIDHVTIISGRNDENNAMMQKILDKKEGEKERDTN